MRLGIVSALAANESMTFNDLKSLMNTTDGNLSVHARKLEDGGYIACTKSFEGRLPKTEYKLTAAGKRALESYLSHMESLIQQMRNRMKPRSPFFACSLCKAKHFEQIEGKCADTGGTLPPLANFVSDSLKLSSSYSTESLIP